MKPVDMAKKSLEKAAQDEVLLDKVLQDREIADEIIGFHCQQAVEKILKALLTYNRIEFRKTHDLAELMDLLADNGYPVLQKTPFPEWRILQPPLKEIR